MHGIGTEPSIEIARMHTFNWHLARGDGGGQPVFRVFRQNSPIDAA